jgi:hypothetical protein
MFYVEDRAITFAISNISLNFDATKKKSDKTYAVSKST